MLNRLSTRWGIGLAAALSVALALAGREIFYGVPVSGELLGKLSLKWALGLGLAWLGLAAAAALAWLAALAPARLAGLGRGLARRRSGIFGGAPADPQPGAAAEAQSHGAAETPLALTAGDAPHPVSKPPSSLSPALAFLISIVLAAGVAFILPILLFFTLPGIGLGGQFTRLVLLLAAAAVIGFLTTRSATRPISLPAFLGGLIAAGAAHLIVHRFSGVSMYPFSLSWSEGNRLFDYSLVVDPGRYTILDPQSLRYGGYGRNLLWGLPFLLPDTSIALHRAWDGVLWTLPYLALGWGLAAYAGARRWLRLAFAGWLFLFLFQGPIYSPLLLSALAVVWAAAYWGDLRRSPTAADTPDAPTNPWRMLLAAAVVAAAGYYAALSRWTWLPAAVIWPALLLSETLPTDWLSALRMRRWRGLISGFGPVLLISLAGLAGGWLANPKLLQVERLKTSTTLAQPLLWYRLLPNATFPWGVLPALALAVGPLLVLMGGWLYTRRWRVSGLTALAAGAGLTVLLGGGLVASVKIGGGSNLHNLDMFLTTMAILAAMAWRGANGGGLLRSGGVGVGARWLPAVLTLAVLLPAWAAMSSGQPLVFPDGEVWRKALGVVNRQVQEAKTSGEVLFIDQRQLLTFGYLTDVPLVAAYEKRYLMDHAMAGDEAYFAPFYDDLKAHRFALIVSDLQFVSKKNSSYAFGEENNAWSHWVSQPLLCYYAPMRTLQEVDVQLLVPRLRKPPAGLTCP